MAGLSSSWPLTSNPGTEPTCPAHIKTEPEDEQDFEIELQYTECKSEASDPLQLLHADHEVKEEMVIGPTEIRHPMPSDHSLSVPSGGNASMHSNKLNQLSNDLDFSHLTTDQREEQIIETLQCDVVLAQVTSNRQATRGRVAALAAPVRRELKGRKREAQLKRMLMPDAPPARKRRTKNPSPERTSRILLPPRSACLAPTPRTPSPAPAPRMPRPTPAGEPISRSTPRRRSPSPKPPQSPRPISNFYIPQIEQVTEYDLLDGETELRAEAVTFTILEPESHQPQPQPGTSRIPQPQPGTSRMMPTAVDVNDASFPDIILAFSNNEDSDDDDLDVDLDINDVSEGFAIPILAPRMVDDNPFNNFGLNEDQVRMLQVEEAANDQFEREIAQPEDFDFDWTSDRRTFIGTREHFTGSPGPSFLVTDDMTAVDIFHKMFDQDFLDLLVTETNEYAAQKLQLLKDDPSTSKHCRALRWKPTDRTEMVAFLTFMILQGLYPKVKEESYFNHDGFGTTPYFKLIMSYNRYMLLKTFLHFVNNRTSTDQTKLNKVRPVIDYFNTKFSSLYTPGREIAIDESLLKWCGRLSFAQKIATKAAQVSVKTYELCESSTGYLWAFRVYTGKDGPNKRPTRPDHDDGYGQRPDIPEEYPQQSDGDDSQTDRPRDRETELTARQRDAEDRQTDIPVSNSDNSEFRPSNATAKIVYDLIEPLLHRGHTLIMDNFYNSPLLARCLKKSKTDVFGTLRLTRQFAPDPLKSLTKSDLKKGEVVASYCPDLSVMLWRDSNLVSMISTFHALQIGTVEKHNREVHKPAIVLDYNKSMGGVDRKDQHLAAQPLERTRNKIWYKKLFRRLFNAAIFNCFVIFTSSSTNKYSHRQFRIILAEALAKQYIQIDIKTEARLIKPKTTALSQALVKQASVRPYVEGNHFPVHTGSKSTTCWLCPREYKQKSRTSYKCEECNVNLCIISCFKAFHKPPRN